MLTFIHIACTWQHVEFFIVLFHIFAYTEEVPVWSLSALTDGYFFFLLNRQGTCRRVAGSQDGSKGTASMEHTAMSEATGRQGNRRNGLDAVTYLAVSATIQSHGCPRCTPARVSKEAVVGVDSILIFQRYIIDWFLSHLWYKEELRCSPCCPIHIHKRWDIKRNQIPNLIYRYTFANIVAKIVNNIISLVSGENG